jgi:hypothetical protein
MIPHLAEFVDDLAFCLWSGAGSEGNAVSGERFLEDGTPGTLADGRDGHGWRGRGRRRGWHVGRPAEDGLAPGCGDCCFRRCLLYRFGCFRGSGGLLCRLLESRSGGFRRSFLNRGFGCFFGGRFFDGCLLWGCLLDWAHCGFSFGNGRTRYLLFCGGDAFGSRGRSGGFFAGLEGLFGKGCLEFGLDVCAGEIAGGFAEAFDVVKGALFGEEDVNDDVDVVEENPLGLAAPFDRMCVEAELFFEAEFDFVGDGDDLSIIGGRGDEEEVGEPGVCRVELEDASVFAFFVFAGADGDEELAAGFRSCHCLRVSPNALKRHHSC